MHAAKLQFTIACVPNMTTPTPTPKLHSRMPKTAGLALSPPPKLMLLSLCLKQIPSWVQSQMHNPNFLSPPTIEPTPVQLVENLLATPLPWHAPQPLQTHVSPSLPLSPPASTKNPPPHHHQATELFNADPKCHHRNPTRVLLTMASPPSHTGLGLSRHPPHADNALY